MLWTDALDDFEPLTCSGANYLEAIIASYEYAPFGSSMVLLS